MSAVEVLSYIPYLADFCQSLYQKSFERVSRPERMAFLLAHRRKSDVSDNGGRG